MLLKHQRHRTLSVDMTAMADVAFLLLIFLISSRFRPENSVTVEPPVSRYSIGVCGMNESPGMLVYVKDNRVYIDITDPEVKKQTLRNMAHRYGVRFTDGELHKFIDMGNFGSPMRQLSEAIRQYKPYPNGIVPAGIPIDYSRHNEFFTWLGETRSVFEKKHEHNMQISIVAGPNEAYPVMKLVIANLQYQQINKFSLMVDARRPAYDDQ
jgi:biopolymer transport protein ExbD